MNYPLIKKFLPELCVFSGGTVDYVSAEDLEAELAKGVEVYGETLDDENVIAGITKEKITSDTHSGLLIGYKPIESRKPVTVKNLLEILKKVEHNDPSGDIDELISRIEKNGVLND